MLRVHLFDTVVPEGRAHFQQFSLICMVSRQCVVGWDVLAVAAEKISTPLQSCVASWFKIAKMIRSVFTVTSKFARFSVDLQSSNSIIPTYEMHQVMFSLQRFIF